MKNQYLLIYYINLKKLLMYILFVKDVFIYNYGHFICDFLPNLNDHKINYKNIFQNYIRLNHIIYHIYDLYNNYNFHNDIIKIHIFFYKLHIDKYISHIKLYNQKINFFLIISPNKIFILIYKPKKDFFFKFLSPNKIFF